MWRCTKVCFPTFEEAEAFVAWLRRRKGQRRYPASIRFYRCNRCGNIHFTREPKRVLTSKAEGDE